jgi:hypothetical protein
MYILKNVFLLLSISLLVVSCSKDEKSVEGNWKFTSIVSTNCTDSEANGTLNFTNGCFSEELLGFEFELCANLVMTDKNYTITSTTTFLGETETETETGTYTIDGDNITLTSSSGEMIQGTVNSDRNRITIRDNDPDTGCDQEITIAK